jgi:hypothetical protein
MNIASAPNVQTISELLNAARLRNGMTPAGGTQKAGATGLARFADALGKITARSAMTGPDQAAAKVVRPAVFPKIEKQAPAAPAKILGERIDVMA